MRTTDISTNASFELTVKQERRKEVYVAAEWPDFKHSFTACKQNMASFPVIYSQLEETMGQFKLSTKVDCRGSTGIVRKICLFMCDVVPTARLCLKQ